MGYHGVSPGRKRGVHPLDELYEPENREGAQREWTEPKPEEYCPTGGIPEGSQVNPRPWLYGLNETFTVESGKY